VKRRALNVCQEHLRRVCDVSRKVPQLIECFINQDKERAKQLFVEIRTGEVEVDNYTGFSGAHTAIIPGLAALPTVEAQRKIFFKGEIKPGVTVLNPLKEDVFEAIKLTGCDFVVQLVTNLHGKLLTAFAGSLEETWGQAIYALGASYQINAGERVI
jgi:nickel-dependent lactate racemase